jgi:hypothetical protein
VPVSRTAPSGGPAEFISVPVVSFTALPEGITPEIGASFYGNWMITGSSLLTDSRASGTRCQRLFSSKALIFKSVVAEWTAEMHLRFFREGGGAGEIALNARIGP